MMRKLTTKKAFCVTLLIFLLYQITIWNVPYKSDSFQLLRLKEKNRDSDLLLKGNHFEQNVPYKLDSFQLLQLKETDRDCDLLLKGNPFEQNASLTFGRHNQVLFDAYYTNITNCAAFIKERKYLTDEASAEELAYPIAFTIVAHGRLFQLERLLRAIYRSHNAYCIHVDLKASKEMFLGVQKIVSCFPNVQLASKRFDVTWGRFSLLEADFQCIQDLSWSKRPFKYLINLCGEDFPLKTNLELVRILKVFNGSNDVDAQVKVILPRRKPKEYPPFPIRYAKGSIHITASRGFVDYIVNSPRAKQVYEILRRHDAKGWSIPDETFYSTMNSNPNSLPAPGANFNVDTNDAKQMFITRLKIWKFVLINKNSYALSFLCKSRQFVHDICILGVRDLPYLLRSPQLFANKFNWEFQPDALTCLEQHIRKRTLDNMRTGKIAGLDLNLYRNLSFVRNHI